MTVGRIKGVIGRPAVIELMGPDTRHTLFGQFVHFLIGELVPFVDNDRVDPGVVGSCSGGNIEVGSGFVQVMHDLRMILQECPHDVFAQLQRQSEVVPVIVVGHIFPPVKWPAGIVSLRIFSVGHGHIDLFIATIHFQNRGDQHDGILTDGFDEVRFVHSDAVGQLHQHFRRPGFTRMHGPCGPVHRLGIFNELLGFLLRNLAWVSQFGVDVFVLLKVLDRIFVGNDNQDHFPPFLGCASWKNLNPRRSVRERPHVFVDFV